MKKPLNYEARSSYDMVIRAQDAGAVPLSSSANVLIEVNDIQDQVPVFLNGPYSVSIPENVPTGTTIFEIKVRDGDTGIPRKIELEILGDSENFFELEVFGHSPDGVLSASLVSLNLKFPIVNVVDTETYFSYRSNQKALSLIGSFQAFLEKVVSMLSNSRPRKCLKME